MLMFLFRKPDVILTGKDGEIRLMKSYAIDGRRFADSASRTVMLNDDGTVTGWYYQGSVARWEWIDKSRNGA